jgi:hypothetical protein
MTMVSEPTRIHEACGREVVPRVATFPDFDKPYWCRYCDRSIADGNVIRVADVDARGQR